MRVFVDDILTHGASSTGFAAILGPASKEKHRTRALSCLFQPHHSASAETHTGTHTQTRTRTHAARHSTAQHTCSVAILSSNDGKETAVRGRSRGSPSFKTVPIQRDTHTHTHLKTHTYTHGHTDARHTHAPAHTDVYRHRHAHTHCDDPFPMCRSVFFLQFLQQHSRAPHLTDAMGLSGDAASSSPRALGTFLRKSLGNRGGVHVVFCPGMGEGGVDMRTSSGTCGPNWDWKPRAGRGSRRAGKTSTRMRSSPKPEPTRPGFRGFSD